MVWNYIEEEGDHTRRKCGRDDFSREEHRGR
jgi:hypothetical protein